MDEKEKMELLLDNIMKNCLWQFNSRAWDRRKQNQGVLSKTAEILCGEEVVNETPLDKCYWVDAVILARSWHKAFPWLAGMEKEEIRGVIKSLHERLDWLTIDGSLNKELTVQAY